MNDKMKEYRTKIGLELVIFLAVIFISMWNWWYIFLIFIISLFLYSKYIIKDNDLIINILGFKYCVIKINEIISIEETNNPISSPASSLDRLKIKYGKGDFVIISPIKKLDFIKELQKINPNIDVKEKEKNWFSELISKLGI
ncbi:MAG: PH domain-containing protein [Bergeyella zoohelcum]|nr:PH domain-containing protein [Bergeyella zoohelcum]